METLLRILEDIKPGIDYLSATKLIDEGWLDSLSLLSLVSELEEAFDIEILPVNLVPANFNSAAALFSMVERLQKESRA